MNSSRLFAVFRPLKRSGYLLSRSQITLHHRCFSSLPPELQSERQELLQEARALTLAMYRLCVRSVAVIRHGNEADEQEFTRREQERLESTSSSSSSSIDGNKKLTMLSMLPPVNRVDELRSRAEYYMQYTHENFVQESDCLDHEEWDEQHISRYLYHLRRGDEQRKWLLKDMKFSDPYGGAFDHEKVKRFEKKANGHVAKLRELKEAKLSPELQEYLRKQREKNEDSGDGDSDDDDGAWSDDEEFAESNIPEWYKNPKKDGYF